jgi:hypothetical protein
MAKTLAEFKFLLLGKQFYGTKRLWWDSVVQDTVVCQRYETTGRMKQMGTHNTSENGRRAWVALSAHPTRTDTEIWDVLHCIWAKETWEQKCVATDTAVSSAAGLIFSQIPTVFIFSAFPQSLGKSRDMYEGESVNKVNWSIASTQPFWQLTVSDNNVTFIAKEITSAVCSDKQ